MRKTTATAVALAACMSAQLFAQSKEDVITFALTGQRQTSVSTTTGNNVGNWTDGPRYYKTGTTKVTDKDIIKYIAYVLHGNASFYSSQAKLVLVQGELSGFFNITPDLGNSVAHDHITDASGGTTIDGLFYTADTDSSTDLANSQNSSYVALANGRHLDINPFDNTLYPVGHLQPWGQIYVKDTGKAGWSVANPLCENVTYFFALSVEECYDCFYMNSFVSDATFTVNSAQQAGPPCCGVASTMLGKGKDRYYLTLSFDNTENNPYLNPLTVSYVGVTGIGPDSTPAGPIAGDGINPDQINPYNDRIATLIGKNLPYEARFTLNGILTYTWNLKFVNTSDIYPDFVGTAVYPAYGYGFIGLYCQLLSGTATFTEKIVKSTCCTGQDWYNDWYGVGAEYVAASAALTTTGLAYQSKYSDGGYPTPMNVAPSLTYHENFDATYPWNARNDTGPSGWPTPAIAVQLGL